MSQQDLEARVGAVEREQARQGVKLDAAIAKIDGIGADIKRIVDRGEPMSLRTIAATCAALAAIAIVGGWLVERAPVIEGVVRRLDALDNEKTGRVTRLEKDAAWTARVVVGR